MHETWTNEDILAKFSGKNCWTFIDNKAVTFIFVGRFWEPRFAEISLEIFLALRKFVFSWYLGIKRKQNFLLSLFRI